MRIASQFVAFLVVLASLAGSCLAASKAISSELAPIESGGSYSFVSPNLGVTESLSKTVEISSPCKDDCEKKQCSKAVINRVVTQVRFVFVPINDGPVSIAPYKARLRDRKLSNLFAKNTRPCNRSVDLFALCRQLN